MELNDYLHNFFNISSDVMCMIDREMNIVKTNLSFEKTLGYNLSDIADKKFLKIIHSEDQRLIEKYLQDVLTVIEPLATKSRVVSSDESIKWFRWTFFYPQNSKYIYACATDFTLEQEAKTTLIKKNREMAEDKAKLDAMLASIGEGVVGFSDGGEILYMNTSAENVLGFAENEVKGKLILHALSLFEAKGTEISIGTNPIRNAIMSGRTIYSSDYYFKKKNGSLIPVSITASAVKYREALLGGVVVFRDITQEKEIDRMKTEFISLASHQLRTPLSSMKWLAEALLDGDAGKLKKEQKDLLLKIYRSNERMIELVNALLNISRIESGRLMIDPVPIDITQLIKEVLKDMQNAIDKKGIKLSFSLYDRLPTVSLDPKLVRHVFMNLINNSIKYTHQGGEISVVVSKDEKEIICRISDTGIGIPSEEKKHLFQKFFRARNAKSTITDGTGLGLYLVKQIVQVSGGRIWFESEENEGSSFWVAFPLGGSPRQEGEVAIDS